MALPWFRMYSEAVDDDKLRLLAFEDRWHFVALMCCTAQGLLAQDYPDLLHRSLAVKLGVQARELEEIIRRLAEVGLCSLHTNEQCNELVLNGWAKRQFDSDRSAKRTREYRERQKKQGVTDEHRHCDVTEQSRTRHRDALDTDTDTDTDPPKPPKGGDWPGFEQFWQAWPNKANKARAKKAWNKAKPDEALQARIITAVETSKRSHPQWLKDSGQFIPHAATWLNGEQWEDEIQTAPAEQIHYREGLEA